MPKNPQKFPPELKVRLTVDWLVNHTAIFAPHEGERPFSSITAFRIKKRFEAYWNAWIAPDLDKIMAELENNQKKVLKVGDSDKKG